MLTLHLLGSLVLGFVAALWGWCEGYSLSGMLGLYVLGGNAGLIGSAAWAVLRPTAPMPTELSDVAQTA